MKTMTMINLSVVGTHSSIRFLRRSSKVVPLSSGDLNYSSEEKIIGGISAMHLLSHVENSVKFQRNIAEILSDPSTTLSDPMLIQEYVEDGVEILDACNFLLEKIGFIKKYAESIQMTVHLIKPGMTPVAVRRVKELLDKRRYTQGDMDLRRSRLKRLVSKLKRRSSENCDILTRSMVDVLDTCQCLDTALLFKSGSRSSTSESTGQMVELRDVMDWAKRLRDLTVEKSGEIDTWNVETLENKCERLAEGVDLLEKKVRELYSRLVCVRMTFLRILPYNIELI